MKKLMIALLAVVMSAFMAVPAFAATSTGQKGSIEVTNKHEGQTYTAYKVFDVTYDGDNYSYTIDSSSPWFESTKANFDMEQVNGTTTYNVKELKAGKSAATAANDFNAVQPKPAGIELTNGKAENLDLGYYFVTTTTGSVCNLTTTNPSVTIVDKNEQPPFEKVVDDQDVNIGQTINYTITGKVPDTTGYANYTYEVTDALSNGLTLNHNVKVMFGDTEITSGTLNYDANGFTLNFDMTKYQAHVGKTITITYSAVVNENAVVGAAGNPNAAQLKYSNDPADSTKTKTEDSKVDVYTCEVNILKHKASDEASLLAGAKFKLYKNDAGQKLYYKWNDTDKKVEWVSEADADVVATTADGKAQFKGLEANIYYLTETEAPAGFNKLTSDVTVNVTRTHADGNVVITGNDVKVPNSSGIELPSTGDMGTKILYAIGGALIIGAAVALVARKRASHRN